MKFISTVLALCASVVSAQTIADIVFASDIHTTLEAALLATDLSILSDPEGVELTLFAPDDAAFSNLAGAVGEDYLADLLTPEWFAHLNCLLESHLVEGSLLSSAITGPMNVTTINGYTLSLDIIDGIVLVNNSPVTIPDIAADNGIVHSISLFPILPTCVINTIADLSEATDNFSILVSLVTEAGLLDTLATTRPLTFFAPNNAAFQAISSDILEYLGSNVTALTEVLTYHVLAGINILDTIENEGEFETLNGDSFTIKGVIINESSEILSINTLVSNGVVHVIDSVLLPPSLFLPVFDTMAPVTVAPATIAPATMAPVTTLPPIAPLPTIAGIVVASEAHNTLEAAVLAAPDEILEFLSNPSPNNLTLFAPDDDAFTAFIGAVGQEFFDKLLTPEWGFHLSCLLSSHILGSAVPSSAITGPIDVTSVSGQVLKADNMDGAITIDGNSVTGPDIMASNGIVHSISGLPILPDCVTISIEGLGNATADLSTLMSLVSATSLGDTLNSGSPLTLFAPTNAAFDMVAPEILAYLGGNMTALKEVLTYHVVAGILVFGDMGTFPTSPDGDYTTVNGDNLIIADATINTVDLPMFPELASNGLVHVIGSVLIPPSLFLPSFDTMAPVTMAPVTMAPVTMAPVTMAPVIVAPVTMAPGTEVPVSEAASTGIFVVGFMSGALSLLVTLQG